MVPKVIWPRARGAHTLLTMEQNYSQMTSPLLRTEDYDDLRRWQERQHAIGPKVRTLVVLVLSVGMWYSQYAALKSRSDRVLAQHSALQAQYDSL